MPLVNLHRFSYFPTGHALSNSFRTQRWEYWCTKVLLQGCPSRGPRGGGRHDPSDFGRSGDGGRLYPPDYYLPPHPGFSDFPTSLFSFDMVQVVGPSLRKNSRTANSIFPEVDEKLWWSTMHIKKGSLSCQRCLACCSLEFSTALLKNKIINLLIEM